MLAHDKMVLFRVPQVCDVKQVQLDSIGYTMMDCCAYLGAFERDKSEEFFAHAQHFFKASNTEMPEFIVNAYRYGSFGKVRMLV